MLSNLIDVRAAAGWRAESSLAVLDAGLTGNVRATVLGGSVLGGTALPGMDLGVRHLGVGVLSVARPRSAQGPFMPGLGQAPSRTSASGNQHTGNQHTDKQDTSKKYQYATRIAAMGGNATGSHPASWDPV